MRCGLAILDADTRELFGKLLGKQGHPEEARAQFQELVRLKPGYAEAYGFLGSTYIDTNQPDLAARNFTQAIELNPRLPSAFNGLGVAWGQRETWAQAEKCFAKAVELSPTISTPGSTSTKLGRFRDCRRSRARSKRFALTAYFVGGSDASP